tara:strand:- start:3610 stop:4935 length:1326 start_codon:yes stop_codon:yes gene_type:complete
MLPDLGQLALASTTPTGVTVHADGSATLTPKEWADLSGLIGGPSAPTPAPAPAPARRRRTHVVRHDDDSSSSEDERPLAARVPPPSKRRHRRKAAARPPRTVARDDPDTLSDLLREDELAAILGAIGTTEEAKASACADAKAWCALNKEHKAACDSHPQVWQSLTERIFDPGPADDDKEVAMGKHLIYNTFKDDANPQKAFLSMCGATGLADVLEKRFVMFASQPYGEMLWERWADVRADVTGLGEAIEDLSGEEADKLAEEYDPDIFKADEWEADAKALFDRAPPKALYLDKYRNDRAFGKLVDNLFNGTAKYLFVDPGAIHDMDNDANALDALYMIGELLGIYIVCLWQLERDRDDFNDKHGGDDDPMPGDVFGTHYYKKDVAIQNLRVRINYAIDLILDPTNATEITDHGLFTEFQIELRDYDTESEFDGGSDGLDVD